MAKPYFSLAPWITTYMFSKSRHLEHLICTSKAPDVAFGAEKMCTFTTHYALPRNILKCQLCIMEKYESQFCIWVEDPEIEKGTCKLCGEIDLKLIVLS